MSKAMAVLLLVAALIIGAIGGVQLESMANPLDEAAIGQQYLGDAECLEFNMAMLAPPFLKIGKQVLCGYHLEWGNPTGGVEPKHFAPDPHGA